MQPAVPAIAFDPLSRGARSFLSDLVRVHGPRLDKLLRTRRENQARIDVGATLDFLPETVAVREAAWRIAPVPEALRDRVTRLTTAVDGERLSEALASGADAVVADFEDATSPTWRNVLDGQRNLAEAARRTAFESLPTLIVRPRGLHHVEKRMTTAGRSVPAALVDAGLFLFHHARTLHEHGHGPFLSLPKLESHLEARWWNSVFVHAQEALGLPLGSIKATVALETFPAAFEMDELLYELRNHVAGLSFNRRNYVFSFLKTHRAWKGQVAPDHSQITMAQPFLRAVTQLLVETCRRRGATAIGESATEVPVAGDLGATDLARARVRGDLRRQVLDGHDATSIAHAAWVGPARETFTAPDAAAAPALDEAGLRVTAADLRATPLGTRTEAGLRENTNLGVRALEAWLRGSGRGALEGALLDAATAELCRTQVWHWLRHGATLIDGRLVSPGLVRAILEEETRGLTGGRFRDARTLFARLSFAERLAPFFRSQGAELLDPSPTRPTELTRKPVP